jgi:uncharacterized repeat protein (TIGR03803 family)
MQASDGAFYGTTVLGGHYNQGTVFRMAADGSLDTVYSFTGGSDGGQPQVTLVQDAAGYLYGTTSAGAAYDWGTVFRLTTNGAITTLVVFDGTNGFFANAGLIQGTDGSFYGVTWAGGAYGHGTVFRLAADASFTTLFSFNGTDGDSPMGSLLQAKDGNFYGTTAAGGANGRGTIFALTPGGTMTNLFSFNGTNGFEARSQLTQDKDGTFYGTTAYGGIGFPGSKGNGTVFRLAPDGTLTTLHAFAGGTDGSNPFAGLLLGDDSNFYGAASSGGSYLYYGTIFQVSPEGAFTNLLSFVGGNPGCPSGADPMGSLLKGDDGNLYGTTWSPGSIFRLGIPMPPVLQPPWLNAGATLLSWTAVAGQTYQLEFNPNLDPTNWTALGNPTTATNGLMSMTDTGVRDPQRFYRVLLMP